ncbi:MAG: hypothetical protein PHE86_03410 [Candidatus Marinimicrobia bacterium]|nr:hypothetical protein [Candidatus Neomarinimicrobiota bacterium]
MAAGGLGQHIRSLCQNDEKVHIENMTLPDAFVPHGKRTELLNLVGLSANHIANKIRELLK